jgi:acyl-CoA synthetase (NDP forming)
MSPSEHPLAPLLTPRSMARVGASPRPGSHGRGMLEAATICGFEGALHLVNLRYDQIDTAPCYASLAFRFPAEVLDESVASTN